MKTCLLLLAFLPTLLFAQTPTVGLIQHSQGSLDDGYVFFAPIRGDTTYLIDKCGKEVHKWPSSRKPGLSAYLLPDGSILRTEVMLNPTFNGAGAAGGKIQKIDWNGNVLWSYVLSDSTETQNHDVYPMPNGDVLVDVWTKISDSEAIAAGRNPALLDTNLWSAKIIELQPIGTDSAKIVWQWNLWDHLIQDFDSTKSNYGIVADHPELLNINFLGDGNPTAADWIHMNAVTYNPDLDEIMFSAHNLSEIYIIDHSTTTAEAASHTGGARGKGGDFLYRWGNPQAYDRGTASDQKLFLQHNPTWIPQGYKDGGKIMIFNNGNGRPSGNSSSVDIISPPMDSLGNYTITNGQAYGPTSLDWTYMDSIPSNFYSKSMGSAQRLSNGNTLICEATKGVFFEIDSLKNIVWKYINPVTYTGPISQDSTNTNLQVFRAVFYPASYSGFAGRSLVPGNPIELNPYNYSCSLNTGIIDIKKDQGISIFPNPSDDFFNIKTGNSEKIKTVEVVNLLGQIVLTSNKSKIDLSGVQSGLYFIKIMTNDNRIIIKKVIKS